MATLREVGKMDAPIRRASWQPGIYIVAIGDASTIRICRGDEGSAPYAFSYEDFVADDWERVSG